MLAVASSTDSNTHSPLPSRALQSQARRSESLLAWAWGGCKREGGCCDGRSRGGGGNLVYTGCSRLALANFLQELSCGGSEQLSQSFVQADASARPALSGRNPSAHPCVSHASLRTYAPLHRVHTPFLSTLVPVAAMRRINGQALDERRQFYAKKQELPQYCSISKQTSRTFKSHNIKVRGWARIPESWLKPNMPFESSKSGEAEPRFPVYFVENLLRDTTVSVCFRTCLVGKPTKEAGKLIQRQTTLEPTHTLTHIQTYVLCF